jgi:hypothetical protein
METLNVSAFNDVGGIFIVNIYGIVVFMYTNVVLNMVKNAV